MRETGVGTSLVLIAIGGVLAFAVNYRVTGVNINAVGAILLVVGLLGLLLSLAFYADFIGASSGRRRSYHDDTVVDDSYDEVHHTHIVP